MLFRETSEELGSEGESERAVAVLSGLEHRHCARPLPGAVVAIAFPAGDPAEEESATVALSRLRRIIRAAVDAVVLGHEPRALDAPGHTVARGEVVGELGVDEVPPVPPPEHTGALMGDVSARIPKRFRDLPVCEVGGHTLGDHSPAPGGSI